MLTGLGLLVLEDDRDTRELFAASLTKLGAEVRSASTAEAALAHLETWRPDAVLCDLHMPGVDGYSFLAQVQQQPALRGIPVIAISASHPDIERSRALEAGFAAHLTKPSKLSEIISAVTTLVQRERSGTAPCVS
ncbi:MAG: response regulator [Myxococcota bacterium]|nr:response regulator [Myxococcota bacterium]